MPYKKKIGLFTMPLGTNYGGIIQLVALQGFLMQNGYETVVIDRRYPVSVLKRIVKHFIEKNGIFDLKGIAYQKEIASEINEFKSEHFKAITKPLYTNAKLTKEVQEQNFDAIVVGSDQVWRIDYMHGIWKNAFLDFVKNTDTKKISYAASFGKEKWEFDNFSNEIAAFLREFDAVSVREDSGVKICKEHLQLSTAQHVLDPTLLMGADFYYRISQTSANSKKNEIFAYILDVDAHAENIIKEAETVLKKTAYVIDDRKRINRHKKMKGYKKPGVEEWLKSFMEADFVITDSFHGTIFSIIFNKPFITLANKKRGMTRFWSLLKKLGLENRLVYRDRNFDRKLFFHKIDYTTVNNKIDVWRDFSKSFLVNAIEN